mmetsp:Transcript_5270/g.10882  ORF Transcript_5270/g.10882 Transcript_5270/m.10882 type:complete len:92 (+) Transcript_5270:1020-1295(+)
MQQVREDMERSRVVDGKRKCDVRNEIMGTIMEYFKDVYDASTISHEMSFVALRISNMSFRLDEKLMSFVPSSSMTQNMNPRGALLVSSSFL